MAGRDRSWPVVVVDPYSSGAMLAGELRAAGVRPVAVLSSPRPPDVYAGSYRPADFDEIHVHTGELSRLVETVAALEPLAVLPGTECGVELADTLAAATTPATANVPGLAAARRHKGAMADRLGEVGLRRVRQICTSDEAAVARWIREAGLAGTPLVLKPPKSAGTDGVVRVAAGDDWRPAFRHLLGARNKLELDNDTVVVQEFLVGDEYVVDTFTYDGTHTVTDVCRYRKVTNAGHIAVYDAMDFLPHDDPVVEPLLGYTYKVLDALGVRNGAAHSEVMVTAAGPVLIETGVRMHGGGHPEFCRVATGDSQLDRTVGWFALGREPQPAYRLRNHVRVAFLIASRAGRVRGLEPLEELADLPSHYRSAIAVGEGDEVAPTRDLFTAMGFVVLAHPDLGQLERDYAAVKRAERDVLAAEVTAGGG